MKMNAVVDLLLNFDKMSMSRKIQRSQDVENMVSSFQGRSPRTVTTKLNKNTIKIIRETGRVPDAFYDRGDNKKLYIVNMSSNIDLVKSIIHEGWHAYIDDFLKGKTMLKTFSKFDRREFLFAEENLPSIYHEIEQNNLYHLYDSFFPEERVNYLEDSLYMIKYITEAIETASDTFALEPYLLLSLLYYIENEARGKKFEKEYSVKYEDVLKKVASLKSPQKIDVSKAGRSKDLIDEELLNFFYKMLVPYTTFYNAEHNQLLSQETKNQIFEEKIQELRKICFEYISQKIKRKIFN